MNSTNWRIKQAYDLFKDLDSFKEDPLVRTISCFFRNVNVIMTSVIRDMNTFKDAGNETMANEMESFFDLFFSLESEMEELILENKERLE